MTKEQVNPSPKSRFQESNDNLKAHHELLQSPDYQRARDVALAQYSLLIAGEVANAPDSQTSQVKAMQAGIKLVAVHEFLSELHSLAEKPIQNQAPGLARRLDHSN